VAESKRAQSSEASALARASSAEAAQETAEADARASKKRVRAEVQGARRQAAGESARTDNAVRYAVRAYATTMDISGAPSVGNGCANDSGSGNDSDAGVTNAGIGSHRRKRICLHPAGTELAFLRRQGKGKRGAFPDEVKLMAAKWASGGAFPYDQCEAMYHAFVQVLPGASGMVPNDLLPAGYFQRKLKLSRIMFMLSNALELAHSARRRSLSGDGASDRDVRKGLREFSFSKQRWQGLTAR
jgi:hypothetical protein